MSKLYIVMPVINCLDLTKAAFDSIKSDQSWSFILIDQESNDGTEDWGRSSQYAGLFKERGLTNFHYIKNSPRIPLAAAWNQGVKKALEDPECKYIAILNNDIILHKNTLNHLMAYIDITGYLMATGDNIKDRFAKTPEEGKTWLENTSIPEPFTDYDLWPIEGWRAEGPDFSCFMITPETIRVIGWFDENFIGAYCEDQDYHARFQRARKWIGQYNDQGIDVKKVHAKRLSTAPYYHYASQTAVRNIPLRHDITTQHGKNQNYYVNKWGGEHEFVMDGGGNITPFGDARYNWRWWGGVEKYSGEMLK